MTSRTYYDILGVSTDATSEEISSAKTALVKLYHPDANLDDDLDTTTDMQEILEAYGVLSDPEKRKDYDQTIGVTDRVFRTFTIPEDDESMAEPPSFTTYWTTAEKLSRIVTESIPLFQEGQKKKNPVQKFLHLKHYIAPAAKSKLEDLANQARSCSDLLEQSGIPQEYWDLDIMNWLLIHWSQKPEQDYHLYLAKYDAYLNQEKSAREKKSIHSHAQAYQQDLKRLLTLTD